MEEVVGGTGSANGDVQPIHGGDLALDARVPPSGQEVTAPDDIDLSGDEGDGDARDDSDFAPEDFKRDDVQLSSSSAHSSGDEDSDPEYGAAPRGGTNKKRDAKAPPPRPPRPITAQTSKLRSAGPTPEEIEARQLEQATRESTKACSSRGAPDGGMAARSSGHEGHASARMAPGSSMHGSASAQSLQTSAPHGSKGEASSNGEGSGSDDNEESGSEAMEDGAPERSVPEEQAAAELASVLSMWEFSAIMEFLFRFRAYLSLETVFTVDMLAQAIVHSPGKRVASGSGLRRTTGMQPCHQTRCLTTIIVVGKTTSDSRSGHDT